MMFAASVCDDSRKRLIPRGSRTIPSLAWLRELPSKEQMMLEALSETDDASRVFYSLSEMNISAEGFEGESRTIDHNTFMEDS
jgi:hypothetical protein